MSNVNLHSQITKLLQKETRAVEHISKYSYANQQLSIVHRTLLSNAARRSEWTQICGWF